MKKLSANILYITIILILSLFYLKSLLHTGVILDNIHYINDLAFLSYNFKESLSNNGLPLWTPYFYSGHPLLAIPENYMLDLNLIFILIFNNIYTAMNLSLILYFFIAGLGMYLLVESLLEDKNAAIISAIIFMFNGFMQSFIIHGHINILAGYALMPFIFNFAHKALKSSSWMIYSIFAGIFFALQILSGSIIMFFYTALLVFSYFLFSLCRKNFKTLFFREIAVGILIVIFALGISAVKLLPVLEFTKMSSRSGSVSYQEYLGEPIDLGKIFKIFISNIDYSGISGAIGILGIILLALGILSFRKRIVLFSAVILIFSVLFASGSFVADFMYKVPGFSKQRHVERSLVLFVFSASIIAGYGFSSLIKKIRSFKISYKLQSALMAGVIILVVVEILLLHPLPASTRIVHPEEIGILDYISKDNSHFRTMNLALNDVIGAAAYNYYAQKGISEVKGGGGIWVNDYVLAVSVAQQYLNPEVLGSLNVKYIISGKKIENNDFRFLGEFNMCPRCAVVEAFGPFLYENNKFMPRYFFADGAVLVLGNEKNVKQAIYALMLGDWHPAVVLIDGSGINLNPSLLDKFDSVVLADNSFDESYVEMLRQYRSKGGGIFPDVFGGKTHIPDNELKSLLSTDKTTKEIGIVEYKHNMVSVNPYGGKGWVVASERFSHFPGWKASVNGKNIGLMKANNMASALFIDEETEKIIFLYEPRTYKIGKFITFGFLILLAGLASLWVYKKFSGDKNKA